MPAAKSKAARAIAKAKDRWSAATASLRRQPSRGSVPSCGQFPVSVGRCRGLCGAALSAATGRAAEAQSHGLQVGVGRSVPAAPRGLFIARLATCRVARTACLQPLEAPSPAERSGVSCVTSLSCAVFAASLLPGLFHQCQLNVSVSLEQ